MIAPLRWSAHAALILSLASCASKDGGPAMPPAATAADSGAIQSLFRQYDSTAVLGQGEQFMRLLSDDIVWMVPNEPALSGQKAVWDNRVGPLFAGYTLGIKSTVEEQGAAGDWGFARGGYVFTARPKAGGVAIEERGKFLYVLQRQAQGNWRIARAAWSANHPAP